MGSGLTVIKVHTHWWSPQLTAKAADVGERPQLTGLSLPLSRRPQRETSSLNISSAEGNSVSVLLGLTPRLNTLKVATESKSRTGIFQTEIWKKNSTKELTLDSQSQHRTGTLWKRRLSFTNHCRIVRERNRKEIRQSLCSMKAELDIVAPHQTELKMDMKGSISQIKTAMEASSTEWIAEKAASQEWKRK